MYHALHDEYSTADEDPGAEQICTRVVIRYIKAAREFRV
jgi:hypothetical protein